MCVHDSRSPSALSNERAFSRSTRGLRPRPLGTASGAPPRWRPDSWPTLASLAQKARSSTSDEAPKAPSRGSPSGAGGEFAGFARKEEAARLLTISKSRVAPRSDREHRRCSRFAIGDLAELFAADDF